MVCPSSAKLIWPGKMMGKYSGKLDYTTKRNKSIADEDYIVHRGIVESPVWLMDSVEHDAHLLCTKDSNEESNTQLSSTAWKAPPRRWSCFFAMLGIRSVSFQKLIIRSYTDHFQNGVRSHNHHVIESYSLHRSSACRVGTKFFIHGRRCCSIIGSKTIVLSHTTTRRITIWSCHFQNYPSPSDFDQGILSGRIIQQFSPRQFLVSTTTRWRWSNRTNHFVKVHQVFPTTCGRLRDFEAKTRWGILDIVPGLEHACD